MNVYLPTISVILLLVSCAYLLLQKSRSPGWPLLILGFIAMAAADFCDLQALSNPSQWMHWKHLALIAESLISVTFLAFSLQAYRDHGVRSARWPWLVLLALSLGMVPLAIWVPLDKVFYSPDFGEEHLLFLGKVGFIFYILLVLFLTLILAQFERTFCGLKRAERWRVKYEILGLGFILCLNLLYYSQGILYRSLDLSLTSGRSIAVLVGMSLFFYSRLRRGASRSLVLSQDMAFRSTVILLVGTYLIGLGLAGEGLQYLGSSSQKILFIIVGSLSGFALLIFLLSEKLQRKLRVFLSSHFYKQKYDYRQQWFEYTSALSLAETESEVHHAVLSFFCHSFSLQGGVLFLRDLRSGDIVPTSFYETRVLDKVIYSDDHLVRLIGGRDIVVDVEDVDVSFSKDNLFLFKHCKVRFIVPLIFDSKLQGILFLGQPTNLAENFSFEDFDLMKMLACHTTATILSMRLSQELTSAREMAAAGKVSTFVLHDLKNLVSNLSLVVNNAADYLDDPEFQEDMLDTLNSTVGKMNRLINRLKNLGGEVLLNCEKVDLLHLVKKTVGEYGGAEVRLQGRPVTVLIDSEEIGRVLLNLLLNAKDASSEERPAVIDVEVGQKEGKGFVRVRDFGCGMTQEFIHSRLFKPFQTTKKKGFGIGLFQCRNIVEAHGGHIEVNSVSGEGSTFTLFLPLGTQDCVS